MNLLTALFTQIRRPHFLVFIGVVTVLFGPAFTIFREYHYNIEINPDIQTYLGLANFDFDQSPVRRYRVIVPFLAAAVHWVLGDLLSYLRPSYFFGEEFTLSFSFFLVNTGIMGLAGVAMYKLAEQVKLSPLSIGVGLLAVFTSRTTFYISGLPLVDSLYLLVIATTLLSIATANWRLLVFSVFVGPFAKEAYVFFVPLILWYAPFPKLKTIGILALSGIFVFGFRYGYDTRYALPPTEGLESNFKHLQYIGSSLQQLVSLKGLYNVFTVLGLWNLLWFGLLSSEVRRKFLQRIPRFSLLFLLIIVFHALISGTLSRMFYLITPLAVVWLGIITEEWLFKRVVNRSES